MSWKNYIDSINEVKKYKRRSGKGLERSLKWFLDTGPQKKGGYKKKRARFGKKKFNDIFLYSYSYSFLYGFYRNGGIFHRSNNQT